MTVVVPCYTCQGTGRISADQGAEKDCPVCEGRGYLVNTEYAPPRPAPKEPPVNH